MPGRHVSSRLGRQVVEFDRSDAVVDSVDDALGDLYNHCGSDHFSTTLREVTETHLDGLDMVHVEAVAQLVDARRTATR